MSHLVDRLDDIFRSVQDHIGAKIPRPLPRFVLDVHRNHPSIHRLCNHDRGKSNPATTMHGNPFAIVDPAVIDDPAKCGGKPASQARGRHITDRLGQTDKIRIGERKRHQLRE